MKQTVCRIVSAVLFLAILFCIIIASGRLVFHDVLWDSFYETDKDSIDVAVVGSSGIMSYFQQAQAYGEQGFTSFVLGSPSLTPTMMTNLMDEVMRFQDPDMFVVEIRRVISTLTDDKESVDSDDAFKPTEYLLSRMDPFSPYRWKGLFQNAKDISLGAFMESAFPLFNYHSFLYQGTTLANDLSYGSSWDTFFGSAIHTTSVDYTELGEYQPYLKIDGVSHLGEEGKRIIDEIAAKAEKYGKPLLFVVTPYLEDDEMYSIQAETMEYMQEKGCDFLDCAPYAQEMGLDYSRDFFDERHVNVVGAHKFTSWFAKYLTENYNIRSDHPENITAKWTKLAEDWDKIYPQKAQTAGKNLYYEDPETGELIKKEK